ncbi:MAG: AprI/Inh family metalloprotease inhibitor [Brevundimonas sp.]|uniref:AprI/Inh family metalloprotease inhibitor n=1 Tax=Brevundimonas sp. TaxID=1871086 RepID=UPI00391AC95A
MGFINAGSILSGVMAGALMSSHFLEMSPVTMSTPILPLAETLAGDWRLAWSNGGCVVSLSARPVAMPRPAADAWALSLEQPCAGNPALESIRAWRPASDGMDLTDDQGRTRLFLSRVGRDLYETALPSGQTLRLMRD